MVFMGAELEYDNFELIRGKSRDKVHTKVKRWET